LIRNEDLDPAAAVNLSSSLEDYLEAIFNLTAGGEVARSKDIADSLKVAKSSVTGALKALAEKKLVNYKPYGYVTLTPPGRVAAGRIARKHNIIKSFFVDILGVDDTLAQEAACKAEHALGPGIISRLLDFTEFLTTRNGSGRNLAVEFRNFHRNGKTPPETQMPLSAVPAGRTVRLAGIDAGDGLKSRLAAMGMVGNAEIIVVSNNSPGPFVVNIKGTRIAIGRDMAHKVMVHCDQTGK
jgi:DtxR family transcriptional regulator, Mn-dependent transcriptional regulator